MAQLPTYQRRCMKWYAVMLIVSWIMISTHQAVLVFEGRIASTQAISSYINHAGTVLKRYQRRYPRIGWYLIAIYLAMTCIICGSIAPTLPDIKYDGLCNPIHFRKEALVFVYVHSCRMSFHPLTHPLVLGLQFLKCFYG